MALYRHAASAIRRCGAPPMLPVRAMASLLGHVEPAPKDPIIGVTEAFLADPSPDKVNVRVVRPLSLKTGMDKSGRGVYVNERNVFL
ncbi:aspartate aminotransferase, mitochondrial-like [Hordeum vulgare]|nr:aspartate aminotransferase, mitochondrial-like [Hordeum vulgare]